MPELLVPRLVENPFRELYRGLIVTSMLHSVEQQEALHRDRRRRRRRRRRASRYERAAAELGAAVGALPAEAAAAPAAALEAPLFHAAPAPAVTAAAASLLPPVRVPAPARVVESEQSSSGAKCVVPVLVAGEPWLATGVRRGAATVWVLAAVVLLANTIVVGFDSWSTGVADLALIVLTLVWFATEVADAGSSARPSGSPQHLE